MDWALLPQDRVQWLSLLKVNSLGSIKDDIHLYLLSFTRRTLLRGVSSTVKNKVLRRKFGP
jgi:hypothetical protein